jgi:BCD family chlorophyll transporter-like MFS transporter
MSIGQTTRLTGIWGTGTILSMVGGGMVVIRRFGYLRVMQAGLLLNVIVFMGLIAAGRVGSEALFQGLVFALGLGTGLASAGLLTAVIEFTTAVRAGLLMGIWGLAHEFGQAIGGLMGGAVVDIMRSVTGGDDLIAYATVFAAEAVLLIVALGLSTDLRLDPARHAASSSISVQARAGETAVAVQT